MASLPALSPLPPLGDLGDLVGDVFVRAALARPLTILLSVVASGAILGGIIGWLTWVEDDQEA